MRNLLSTSQAHTYDSDLDSQYIDSLSPEHQYGQPFYPVAPLSWLAPLWSFVCGAAASGEWDWTGNNLLRLLLGLLLSGPLLGLAWATSSKTHWHIQPDNDPPSDATATVVAALPYTVPNSASHHLSRRLRATWLDWQQLKPHLARPLVQLAISSVFALGVAAQLGHTCFALAALELAIVWIGGLRCSRWISQIGFATWTPLFFAWLLGNAAYGEQHLPSAIVAVCFGCVLCACHAVRHGARSVAWQIAPQMVIATTLVLVKQPLAAATVMLLATPQILLLPLVSQPPDDERYFRAVQLGLLIGSLVAALALGYQP